MKNGSEAFIVINMGCVTGQCREMDNRRKTLLIFLITSKYMLKAVHPKSHIRSLSLADLLKSMPQLLQEPILGILLWQAVA